MSTTTAPLLGLVQEAGETVLTLTAGLAQGEFLSSSRTRAEAARHLAELASAMKAMPPEVSRAMPEIDWAAWRGVEASLRMEGPAHEEALWFAISNLLPATLARLVAQRRAHPALFTYWS